MERILSVCSPPRMVVASINTSLTATKKKRKFITSQQCWMTGIISKKPCMKKYIDFHDEKTNCIFDNIKPN